MLQILRSKASKPNPQLAKEVRKKGEDNVAWLARLDPGGVRIVLFGGRDHASFRVRIAQSHGRDDMTPSNWSHAAIVVDPSAKLGARSTKLVHVAIEPKEKHSRLMAKNGVEVVRPTAFASVESYPNVAVLRVEADAAEVARQVDVFRGQRTAMDAIELGLTWLAFVCGVGRTPNPLLEGVGLPSAVLIETVLAAAGFELTPGLPNRSSCPEGIWQAAKWWYEFHASNAPASKDAKAPALHGAWWVEHDLGAALE